MLQVTGLDARDPLSVVHNLGPRLDQGVEDNISVKVDDRNSSESIALFRQNSLTVECQNLRLSARIKSKSKKNVNQQKRNLLATLVALVEHVVEEDSLVGID